MDVFYLLRIKIFDTTKVAKFSQNVVFRCKKNKKFRALRARSSKILQIFRFQINQEGGGFLLKSNIFSEFGGGFSKKSACGAIGQGGL